MPTLFILTVNCFYFLCLFGILIILSFVSAFSIFPDDSISVRFNFYQFFLLCIIKIILYASDFLFFILMYWTFPNLFQYFYNPYFSYLTYSLNLSLMYLYFFKCLKNNFSFFPKLSFVRTPFSQTYKHTQYFLNAQNPYNYV